MFLCTHALSLVFLVVPDISLSLVIRIFLFILLLDSCLCSIPLSFSVIEINPFFAYQLVRLYLDFYCLIPIFFPSTPYLVFYLNLLYFPRKSLIYPPNVYNLFSRSYPCSWYSICSVIMQVAI